MCGIIGYVGHSQAVETIIDALSRLEYRGYDSAGIAVLNSRGLSVRKRVGKIKELAAAIKQRPPEGTLGIGHCLAGDTLIQLADGRVARIDSLQGEMTVLGVDPETLAVVSRRARVWAHPAPPQLIEIRAPFGTIFCTPQHRLFSVDESGRLIEKRAEAFEPGDCVLHARVFECAGTPSAFQAVESARYYRLGDQARTLLRSAVSRAGGRSRVAELAGVSRAAISHLWEPERHAAESVLKTMAACLEEPFPLLDSEPVNSRHGSFITFPTQSSPPLMQWLGYLFGDGSVGPRGIRFKDADAETLKVYRTLSEECFNVPGRLVPIPGVGAHLLELNGLGLAKWVRANVLDRRLQWLDGVGVLPTEHVTAFLRGLFDAEGCVAHHAGQVTLAMTDLELVRRVQLWLLRMGIVASLCPADASPAQRRPHPSLKLLITRGDALLAFRDRIGFSSSRKRARLDQILQHKREGFYLSSRAVPMRKAVILRRLAAAGVPSAILRPFRCGHRFTDRRAQRLVQCVRDFPEAASVTAPLQRLLNSDLRCQTILSVRRIPAREPVVYDLEVEGTQSFFANGILSHNSRWATHGEPTEINAHPHLDCSGHLAVVHNGIIENYAELKARLIKRGHRFKSQTDTEAIAHVIEEYAKRMPVAQAFRRALNELRGSYALGVVSTDDPSHLYGARAGSPLIVGVGEGEMFLASDVTAILSKTRRVLYLNDHELVELSDKGVTLRKLNGAVIRRAPSTVSWDVTAAQKEGCAHFMIKEIREQPRSIGDTLSDRLRASPERIIFDDRVLRLLNRLGSRERLAIIACGTAYHAGLVGEYMLEEMAHIPVDADLASEFRYRGPMLDRHTTVIAITQSGETADTLAGVRLAREQGAKVLAICNVMGSTIAREADAVIYTHAGPEIAVASTKAYTSQLAVLYLLTLYLARHRNLMPTKRWQTLVGGLALLPELIERALKTERVIAGIAQRYAGARDFYYLGRRYNFPTALEGALKLKEICPSIHAEGYAAGEMKHGPISLIRKGWPIVVVATDSPVYEKVISNIEEVRARKGECIVVASEGNREIGRYADALITIPKTEEFFSPMLAAIPLQLLAYHIAKRNRCDIDQPPNLAKSVTVE